MRHDEVSNRPTGLATLAGVESDERIPTAPLGLSENLHYLCRRDPRVGLGERVPIQMTASAEEVRIETELAERAQKVEYLNAADRGRSGVPWDHGSPFRLQVGTSTQGASSGGRVSFKTWGQTLLRAGHLVGTRRTYWKYWNRREAKVADEYGAYASQTP